MSGQLHHMAVNSQNFEETVAFFQTLFQMEIARTRGDAPHRMLWFREGIQVNEVTEVLPGGSRYDHIGIGVADREQVMEKALAMGCKPVPGKEAHWLSTPDGYVLELMVE
ncbi:MAG TPA: hypothetical protein DDY87_00845 [Clostridiales bacterium]|nr:hypothetical protein [Clostridiales bacterium]